MPSASATHCTVAPQTPARCIAWSQRGGASPWTCALGLRTITFLVNSPSPDSQICPRSLRCEVMPSWPTQALVNISASPIASKSNSGREVNAASIRSLSALGMVGAGPSPYVWWPGAEKCAAEIPPTQTHPPPTPLPRSRPPPHPPQLPLHDGLWGRGGGEGSSRPSREAARLTV